MPFSSRSRAKRTPHCWRQGLPQWQTRPRLNDGRASCVGGASEIVWPRCQARWRTRAGARIRVKRLQALRTAVANAAATPLHCYGRIEVRWARCLSSATSRLAYSLGPCRAALDCFRLNMVGCQVSRCDEKPTARTRGRGGATRLLAP